MCVSALGMSQISCLKRHLWKEMNCVKFSEYLNHGHLAWCLTMIKLFIPRISYFIIFYLPYRITMKAQLKITSLKHYVELT